MHDREPLTPPVDHRGRLDTVAVDRLRDRVRREVEEGLTPAAQFALALHGEVVASGTFGDAGDDTRFNMFSCTKALIAGVVWQLVGEGRLSPATTAGEVVPALGADGPDAERMAAVTLEHLLTHTAGFPYAPLGPPEWDTREGRLEAFRRWRLEWEPGSRFEYHPVSAHWVVAEMVAAVTGRDHRDVVRERLLEPLGLRTIALGPAPDPTTEVAELTCLGAWPSDEELIEVFGHADVPQGDLTPEILCVFNNPAARDAGVPGGGANGTAADLALLYQAFLHDPEGLWDPAVLADGTGRIRCTLPDPGTGIPANRSLGLVVAGEDGNAAQRGMGHTASPRTFGHNGAGGQLAWADPATGLSFAHLTAALDRNFIREGRRTASLATRASQCVVVP